MYPEEFGDPLAGRTLPGQGHCSARPLTSPPPIGRKAFPSCRGRPFTQAATAPRRAEQRRARKATSARRGLRWCRVWSWLAQPLHEKRSDQQQCAQSTNDHQEPGESPLPPRPLLRRQNVYDAPETLIGPDVCIYVSPNCRVVIEIGHRDALSRHQLRKDNLFTPTRKILHRILDAREDTIIRQKLVPQANVVGSQFAGIPNYDGVSMNLKRRLSGRWVHANR
jgi:hypothetical protein